MTGAAPSLPASATGLFSGRSRSERRRIWVDRLMTLVASLAAASLLISLLTIIAFVVVSGLPYIDEQFLTKETIGYGEGGALAAMLGSLQMVPLATLIGAPIGILGGIYLAEARPSRISYTIRVATEVLAGLPSVVIGVFAFTFLVAPRGSYSALAGSVALAVIMIPIVARSTEEIVRLVPGSVREAALALGIPVWKTVLRVIVRTALAGILATVMLAVARIAGETAPLILTAVGNQATNVGDFLSPMDSLPTFIWYASGQPSDLLVGQAWAAALILMLFVLIANILVRGRTAGRRRTN